MAEYTNPDIDQQVIFAIEYVKDFNGTRAAERAGYQGDDNVLAVTASRLLRIAKVRRKIVDLLDAHAMGGAEALQRLSEQARLDISVFIRPTDEGGFSLNWRNVKKFGFLIKSITNTKYGPKIELYDAQKALELLAKHHGLLSDVLKIKVEDELNSALDLLEKSLDKETYNRVLAIFSQAGEAETGQV